MKYSAQLLLKQYGTGRRDFREIDLINVNLSNADLSGVNLSSSDIRGTNLSRAILKEAKLCKVEAGIPLRVGFFLAALSCLIAFVACAAASISGFLLLSLLEPELIFIHSISKPAKFVSIWLIITLSLMTITGISQRFSESEIFEFKATWANFFAILTATLGLALGVFGFMIFLVSENLKYHMPYVSNIFYQSFNFDQNFKYVLSIFVLIAIGQAIATGLSIIGVFSYLASKTIPYQMSIIFGFIGAGTGLLIISGKHILIPGLILVAPSVLIGLLSCKGAVGYKSTWASTRGAGTLIACLFGTDFRGADLTKVDFYESILESTNFDKSGNKNTRLTGIYCKNVRGLGFTKTRNSIFADPKVQNLVVSCDGQGKNFDGLDLAGVNLQDARLQGASFVGASLNQSNLRGADLSRAILKQTQLDEADLTGAVLTGAYIEDWGITSATILENVQCDYVYMRVPTEENPHPLRKPDYLEETFAEGGFADFIQPYFDTLDLYHSQKVDPRAISIAFKELSQNHPEANLEIVAMEKRGQNSLNLKVRTAAAADKSELSSEYFADYNQLKALSEAQVLRLAEKDDHIHRLEQMIQTALHQPTFNVETVQGDFMPENRGINVSAGDNANISGVSSGDGILNLGIISGHVTNAINQLPDSSETGQASLKVLLTQLQAAIETDTNLSDPDKSDLLEQVQSLAEAKQTEEPTKREGIVRKAMKMFDATLKSLPDTAKIVEACSKLLPLILKALGIPT
ncbi:MAG: pentapeptide repeat-containing protein [Kastovskya adunca ATA6-11-RM4]|nr:pentapeptide repeat-containing protein [Kastovskya adunca ATA6-11-RM4]